MWANDVTERKREEEREKKLKEGADDVSKEGSGAGHRKEGKGANATN